MTLRVTAFEGTELLASGVLKSVISKTRQRLQEDPGAQILLFNDSTGCQTDVDFRGSVADIVARLQQPEASPQVVGRGKGRPKLGVVSREVTLLPRHWDWLRAQQGGASAALRRLVDEARRVQSSADTALAGQNATYAFLSAMAGNLPGFEEVVRALFAGDGQRFDELVSTWPAAVRNYARDLATAAFGKQDACLG